MQNEQGYEKLKKCIGAIRSLELFEFHSAIELGEELVKYKLTVTDLEWRHALNELNLGSRKAEQLMGMYVYRDLIKTELKAEELNIGKAVKLIDNHKLQVYANRMASLPRVELKDKHKEINMGRFRAN